MAFILSVLLKAALGSSATALVTTASLMAPMLTTTMANPIIVGLAICLGGLGICLPTDGAFWQVKEFNDLTMKETFIAHTGGKFGCLYCGICGIMYLSFVQWISAWTFIEEKRRKPDEAFIRIRFF